MPSITAIPYPTRGQVLLEVNVGDVPGAEYACVEAVTATGRRQLHPYVAYDTAGCIATSCGQAILWDTEISCDTPTTYCVTAVNATGDVITEPTPPIVADPFTRVVSPGWGSTPAGQPWTTTGGAAADQTVTGFRGQQALTTVNVQRIAAIAANNPNIDIYAEWTPQVIALTAPIEGKIVGRRTEATNTDYRMTIRADTVGVCRLVVERNVAGVFTVLTTVVLPFFYTAATLFAGRFRLWGTQIMAKAWDATTPEPAAWTFSGTDTAITTGNIVQLRSLRTVGNTNGTVNAQWDNLLVADVCATVVPVQVCSEAVMIACDGCFRLGDPVRPCNDVRVCLCTGGVECGGTGGIFFAGMTADTYAANAGSMLPVNGIYPINISRNRRAASGTFTVVPRSFGDRDALLTLLAPGGVLLWRGPGEYGTGDRYLAVGDVPVAPGIADLRQQNRLLELPFAVSAPVVGPTQGVCGARVQDLCAVYPTWDAMAAAGLTWASLLRGDGGGVPSGLATWASTNAANASWNALLANEPTWSDVVDGD